jgi:hypothetical protein
MVSPPATMIWSSTLMSTRARACLGGDQAAVVVEVDQGEDFVGKLGESGDEEIAGDPG